MPNTLEFPEGIRLAHWDEIPGPEPDRAAAWARIQSANITPGFTLAESTDSRFAFYAEANVNSSRIWAVFRDLCLGLLGPRATLIIGEIDDEPVPLGSAHTPDLLTVLEPHQYQLAHDGWLQFGLVAQDGDSLTEVFVAPTKHFKMWLGDVNCLRSVLLDHAVPEAERLAFIDEYPRTTTLLVTDKVSFQVRSQLFAHLQRQLNALS